jgi:hypothetical protein
VARSALKGMRKDEALKVLNVEQAIASDRALLKEVSLTFRLLQTQCSNPCLPGYACDVCYVAAL